MLLRSEVSIGRSPAAVFAWLSRIDEHYLEWHPDHISCRYINGDTIAPGSIFFCQEYLHGRPHKFRMRLTGIEPDARIDYNVGFGMSGAFIVEPEGDGARFIAELRLGFSRSFIAGIQDRFLRRMFGWRVEALARHMDEEGANLKRLLESADTSAGVRANDVTAREFQPLKLAESG